MSRSRSRRSTFIISARPRIAAVSGCLILITIGLLVAPPAALAAEHVGCAGGSWSVTFSPPLTSVNQNVQVTYSASYACTVGQSSGIGSSTSNVTLGCNVSGGVLGALSLPVETIQWSPGGTSSTIGYTSTVTEGNSATTQGSVTGGSYQGDNVVRENTVTGGTGDLVPCAAGLGTVSSLTGENDLLNLSS
jgi:hypothetical protein